MKLVIFACLLFCIGCSKKKPVVDDSIDPWNSRYSVEGSLSDITEPRITWPGTYEYSLERVSGTQVKMVSKDLTTVGHLISHGGSLSFYGNFGLLINFDPVTNKITSITNFYGQPSTSGRIAVLDPSGVNSWDPARKKMQIKHWMDETGISGHRTSFSETWTYLGPL